jgi:hypothetical protein
MDTLFYLQPHFTRNAAANGEILGSVSAGSVAAGKQGVARSAPRVTGCCGYNEARRSLTGGFDQVAGSCYG